MHKKIIVTLAVSLLCFIVAVVLMFSTSGKYYQTFSPDRQYSVYASTYFYERFLLKMPGGSGDASGKAYLYDEIKHQLINSASVAIMWTITDIQWEDNKAYFIGEDAPTISNPWLLPRPIKMPYTKTDELDTIKTIKEYSSFDKLQSITILKPINSCWKPLSYQAFDDRGNKLSSWAKRYFQSSNSTCDFTPYFMHALEFDKGALVKEYSYNAACDDCETSPCGTESTWDHDGKVIATKVHKGCEILKSKP